MLAAAVLASWLAQAEPAPTEPAPSATSAPTAPSQPNVPSKAASTPPPPPAPDNAVGVYAGWGHRIGHEAETIGPANGISVGGSY